MDMGKYVAVGVLAVIVLAAATYDKPQTKAGQESAAAEQAAEEPVYAVDYGSLDANEAAAITSSIAPVIEGPAPAGMPIVAPASAETAVANLATQVQEAKKTFEYVVKANQTLSDVAEEVLGDRKAWREIYEANKDRLSDPNHVRAGMKLVYDKVRGKQSAPRAVAKAPQASSVKASAPRSGERNYTVKKGETLYRIAKAQLGSGARWKEIVKLNNIDASKVQVGQVLLLPAR